MISVTKINGASFSKFECDNCGLTYQWQKHVSVTRLEKYARSMGWTVGKLHLCEDCKAKK